MPWIGGAIAGLGALGGGLFGASAAGSAAKTQAQASQNAINTQLGVAGIEQGQLAPFLGGGTNALTALANLFGLNSASGPNQPGGSLQGPFGLRNDLQQMQALGYNVPQLQTANLNIPNPSDPNTIKQFQQSPGYNYALQQSGDAIQNSAAGHTGALSGNTLKALQGNAIGLADQDYYNWLGQATNYGLNTFNAQNQNFMNQFNAADQDYWKLFNANTQGNTQNVNALLQLAQGGQNAAANQGLTQIGGNIGNALIGQGNSIAAGQIGGAQAITGGINNALPYLLQALQGGGNSNSQLPYLFPGNLGGTTQGSNYFGPGVDPSYFPSY